MAEINTAALQSDISKYLRSYAIAYASAAATFGPMIAKQAIEEFYGSYDPVEYIRTENLLNNSYSRYYHNNGNIVYGGVRIHSGNMNEYVGGGWDAATVAKQTWAAGRHGNVHTYPPLSMAAMALGQIEPRCKLIGETTALSQKYSVLKFA